MVAPREAPRAPLVLGEAVHVLLRVVPRDHLPRAFAALGLLRDEPACLRERIGASGALVRRAAACLCRKNDVHPDNARLAMIVMMMMLMMALRRRG